MKLTVQKREAEKKSQAKSLRREGLIPAIIYVRNQAAETICLNAIEWSSLMRKVQSGRLSTTRFTLVMEGKERKVILKDIQYNPVTYEVIHLDFEQLLDQVPVNIKIPVECTGVVDCVGIKLGGFLRQVVRSIRVSCLPKDIPDFFPLNVKDMGIFDCKKVKDLNIPPALKPLVNLNEVVVVIAKR